MAEGATNNSAAAMAQASNPMKIENISIPGFGGGGAASGDFNPKQWKVRYLKIDMDDEASVGMLELLETQGLLGIQTLILNKAAWTFLDKYLMIVTYLEKIS